LLPLCAPTIGLIAVSSFSQHKKPKDLEKKKLITLSHTPYKPLALPHKPVYTAPEKRKAQLKELLNEPMIKTNEYIGIMKNGRLTKLNNTNKWDINKI